MLAFASAGNIFLGQYFEHLQIFFFCYVLGDALLEILALAFLGSLIERHLPKWCLSFYIGLTFLFILMHLISFLLQRIAHFTLLEMLGLLLDESWVNFIYMLAASGLSLAFWLIFFLCVSLVPLAGVVFYRQTDRLAAKKPFSIRSITFVQILFCLSIGLFSWDISASRLLSWEARRLFTRSLPLNLTHFNPSFPQIPLASPPQKPRSAEQTAELIRDFNVKPSSRPNIYLFVVESLRKDAISEKIAPALNAFQQTAVQAPVSLANANTTHISWFSLFHSDFPYRWQEVKKQHRPQASLPLEMLRKMGYQIRVYTAADLNYYGIEELLFGGKKTAAANVQRFAHGGSKAPWQSDAETLLAFERDLAKDPSLQQNQCVIFFWDATHFNYSWPETQSPQFLPAAALSDYFKAPYSKSSIEAIKNRYRNAVRFIDGLFAKFLNLAPRLDEALICVVGDHGEEFFERGRLFHLSQLSDKQTEIPILLKLPKEPSRIPYVMTQMDVFPTLIDALSADTAAASILEGESLYQLEPRRPFALLARYNGSRTPYEICLHNGRKKLLARFENTLDIFSSKSLEILSLRTCKEEPCGDSLSRLQSRASEEFQGAIDRLFSGKQ